jgi:hypothetical protein
MTVTGHRIAAVALQSALAVKSDAYSSHRPPQISGRQPPTSPQIEPADFHDLDPRGDEVADELLAGVIGRVDLGDRAQLGV